MLKKLFGYVALAISIAIISSCASMNSFSNDASMREYDESFEDMLEIVERAIRGSTLGIVRSFEGQDAYTIIVNQEEFVNNERVQSHQGEVKIIEVASDSTAVRIINPDYHFSVPSHQKEDYRRMLFNRIDDVRSG